VRPQEFIGAIALAAQNLQRNTGLFSSLTIAQAALETGWGGYIPMDKDTGQVSNNLFGIKGEGPAGSVWAWTWEEVNGERVEELAEFCAYNSYEECLQDRYEVLLQPRYDRVREAGTPEAAAGFLHICGYATDSSYPQKLTEIIHQFGLKEYDQLPDDPFQGVPEWAVESIRWAMAKGLINTPAGSEDFYRAITVLWNYDKSKGDE